MESPDGDVDAVKVRIQCSHGRVTLPQELMARLDFSSNEYCVEWVDPILTGLIHIDESFDESSIEQQRRQTAVAMEETLPAAKARKLTSQVLRQPKGDHYTWEGS
jgi:hypothetical protein